MQLKSQQRMHGAEFEAQALAECQQPGASVAAIALAHGLSINLLRTGLPAPRTVTCMQPAAAEPAATCEKSTPDPTPPGLHGLLTYRKRAMNPVLERGAAV